MTMPAVWVESAASGSAALLERSGCPSPLANLLARRGVSSAAEAAAFLSPGTEQLRNPLELPGIESARDRLLQATRESERVAVVGDYDADGVTATALLSEVLRFCGLSTTTILPSRFTDGYGFQPAHADAAAAAGCRLIVTVDCGVGAHDAVARARALGLDVIVTDHHLPTEATPAGAIVVDPHLGAAAGPGRELTGVGLALKLAIALLEALGRTVPLESLLRIACLGTIADVAPLLGENRAIAALGLAALATPRSAGLRELLKSARIRAPLRSDDVAFRIAPRLNAAGRLDSADQALELLTTRDPARAAVLAGELERLNRVRQRLELQAVEQARKVFDEQGGRPPVLVAWSEEWHRGVVGIAAGRLARELRRPVVLLSVEDSGQATGSGRSVPQVDLHRFLSPWSSRLLRFGGHAQAIGLTAELSHLETLRDEWTAAAATWPAEWLETRHEYELSLTPYDLTPSFIASLASLEPHGAGNPEPILRIGPLSRLGRPRIFGNGHLEVIGTALGGGGPRFEMVAWGWGAHAGRVGETFEALVTLRPECHGPGRVGCRIVDARSLLPVQEARHDIESS